MNRAARALSLLLLPVLPLVLGACGTERPAATADADRPAANPATGGRATPGTAELDSRAKALGVAPELVYVTASPGYTVVRQSVGVYGGDGFSAVYWSRSSGARIGLFVDRGTLTGADCERVPVGGAGPDDAVVCERDGDAWYRTSGGHHEYALVRDDHVVRLEADSAGVDRAVLKAAARAAHRPDAAELDALLPPLPERTATAPVERGDLPPVGDGAPDNEVNTTG
ncbi:hypothetical protein AB0F07_14725 [Streptomyces fructofermentans]|uniref:hypothetical protein n=1 Tax=Streptomyces fructofermentans TaxID=152141 RepID=UPI0033DB3C0E